MPARDPALARRYRESGLWAGEPLFPILQRTAEHLHDREAIIDGARRITYSDFLIRVQRTAARLAALGVGSGTVVSFQLPNWWETAVAAWAALRLGAVMNPILPIYREREVEFILRESGAEILLVPGAFRRFDHRSLGAEMKKRVPSLREVMVVRDRPAAGQVAFEEESPLPRDGEEPGERRRSSEDIALLMYTSGTTADPKGVLHNHDTLGYECRSLAEVHGLGHGDTVLMPSPLTHISGLLHAVLLPFVLGTRAVLMESWDPDLALDLITEESVTYMVGAPIFLSDLAFHPRLAQRPTTTLRLFSCGGAGVSPDLILESRRRLGCVAKRVYGSTELPTLTTTGGDDAPEKGATTEGRPIGAAEIKIVDDGGRALPPGQEGEIYGRAPECFLGYRNPELDVEAFTADGWFRTGDLGVVDAEGYLTVTGRKKDIVIRKGEKISAPEVEALLERHGAIAGAAVVALPDPVTGERACACLRLRDGAAAPTLQEVGDFLRKQGLASRKLPEALEVLSELPRTASGKVQKHRLRELIAARRSNPG